ncbi:MAG TPA: hypothetical protein VK171_11040 [Fimbriimonas sp.]|nr:hypothetical protein [Fimbriimonas sp.]
MVIEYLNASGKSLIESPISFDPNELANESEPFRVRDLLEKLVRESVRDFKFRETDRQLGFLTSDSIQEGIKRGKLGSPRAETQTVDVDLAVANAWQAFEDKLYLLFVDESEKVSLDELVVLQPETSIKLIRLTALSGGFRFGS